MSPHLTLQLLCRVLAVACALSVLGCGSLWGGECRSDDQCPEHSTCTEGICIVQCTPSPEVCDGKDNDCNGSVDEGCDCLPGETRSCGKDLGECQAGRQACIDGQWSQRCVGAVEPSPEICDGKDNDCNGITDEGCACKTGDEKPCGIGVGTCKTGVQRCEDGVWRPRCFGFQKPAQSEECDGKDNDCNGKVDENISLPCVNNNPGCRQKTDKAGNPLIECEGRCAGGRRTCKEGKLSFCTQQIKPNKEGICNGLDDNCDGKLDESDRAVCSVNRLVGSGFGYRDRPASGEDKAAWAQFRKPSGLVVGPEGQLFLSDTENHLIRLAVPILKGRCSFSQDHEISDLPKAMKGYCVTTIAGTAKKSGSINGPGVATGSSHGATFHRPHGLALGPEGILYVADTDNHLIRKIQRVSKGKCGDQSPYSGFCVETLVGVSGECTCDAYHQKKCVRWKQGCFADGSFSTARFHRPTGLLFDGDRSLYVADTGNHCIRKIDLEAGTVRTYAGKCRLNEANASTKTEDAWLSSPWGLALDDKKQLYVANIGSGRVLRIDPKGQIHSLLSRDPIREPRGLAWDPSDDVLYISDSALHVIFALPLGFDASPRRLRVFAGAQNEPGDHDDYPANARLQNPQLMALPAEGPLKGRLLITDVGNHRIRIVER